MVHYAMRYTVRCMVRCMGMGMVHHTVPYLVLAEGADQPGQPGGRHNVELAYVGRLAPAPPRHLGIYVGECRGNVERHDGGQAGGGEREDETLVGAEPVEGVGRLSVPEEQRAERAQVQRGLLALQLPA